MPKLKQVPIEAFKALDDMCADAGSTAAHLAERIQQGYVPNIPNPLELARSYLAASRSLAELAAALLVRIGMDESRRILDAELRARLNQKDDQ